eukprot:7378399-Prymnesium_polylepis.1
MQTDRALTIAERERNARGASPPLLVDLVADDHTSHASPLPHGELERRCQHGGIISVSNDQGTRVISEGTHVVGSEECRRAQGAYVIDVTLTEDRHIEASAR